MRSEYTAGIVPFPGSANPKASMTQFIVFAVNIPAHDPHVGQALRSISRSSSSSILPAILCPTPSNMFDRSIFLFLYPPANMGPPLRIREGIFSSKTDIAMPGTILSQLVTKTNASKPWALVMISMESLTSSRLGRE